MILGSRAPESGTRWVWIKHIWSDKWKFQLMVDWTHLTVDWTNCPADGTFYYKYDMLVIFLHNSYGTSEFPDFGNREGTDWMEDLRWANTEPFVHFRETSTNLSVHLRKANTDPSMHFGKANTEFLVPALLPTFLTISIPCLYHFLLPVWIPTLLPTCYTTINAM